MNKLFPIILLGLISNQAWALDFSQYKKKIRSHMANMLGEDTTTKIMGAREIEGHENTMTLPEIPKVLLDPKNEKFYDLKKSAIYSQGKKYTNLTNEEKQKFRIAFLRQLYSVTRLAEPKESDLVKSLNVLQQGGNREGVYRSVTLDQTYLALEQYDEDPSEALVNFVQYFPPKFLRKKYQKSSIQKLNLWALKRLIGEKCLELMDTLAQKPEELYRWYAVFSAELASDYPSLWQSNTRKRVEDIYHYKWSKTVPFQHIKSEVVIKLHTVMNHLQKAN